MKNLCVLMICFGVLFLIGCQKNEEVQTAVNEKPITFKKIGDPRNPVDFMSPGEIEIIQEAFNDMKGKKLKNPVIKIEKPLTRAGKGDSEEIDEGVYELSERNIPITDISDEGVLYINVTLTYREKEGTFDTRINYRIGAGASYKLGYKSINNTNTYISDTGNGINRILIDFGCRLVIDLENNPNYRNAIITFPLVMQWDERVGYDNCCEAVINEKSVIIQYTD